MKEPARLEILEAHRLEVGQVLIGDRPRTESRERSISLVRQRWSSRSSGPTKDSTRTVSAGSATAPRPRSSTRRAGAHGSSLTAPRTCVHGLDGRRARALGALVQDLDDLARLLGEALPPLADRGRAAAACARGARPCSRGTRCRRCGSRSRTPRGPPSGVKMPVQIEDGADVGVAGIRAPLARGIGHHRLDLGRDLLGGVREVDRVAVRLGHLPPVRPRHLGDAASAWPRGSGKTGAQVLLKRRATSRVSSMCGHLVGADGHPARLVHQDVGGLKERIAEQPVGGRLQPELLHHLLVGRHALEPARPA